MSADRAKALFCGMILGGVALSCFADAPSVDLAVDILGVVVLATIVLLAVT
jgi:hypothetical protein